MVALVPDIAKQERGSIVIGMGEVVVTSSPGTVLTCIGLGSCIAVCAYDKVAKLGGMIHIVLPQHHNENPQEYSKYADTGVPLMLAKMIQNGANKDRMIVKIAGGAQMTVSPGLKDTFKTGEKNLVHILAALEKVNVGLSAADVGGNLGRTVKMHIATGLVTVKTVNGIEREI
jgi:chemotaxis protein CheD